MDEQLFKHIRIFFDVQRTVDMGIFDNWFTEEARSKRQATPEEAHYSQERKQEERARTDFSSVWSGVSVEHGGVRDGNAPQAWAQKYYDLQKKAKKAQGTFNLEASGVACSFNENGNLTLQGAMGAIQIAQADILPLISKLMQGPPDAMPIQGAYPGGVPGQSHAPMQDNPIQQERMARNIKAMEDFALASSKRWPK